MSITFFIKVSRSTIRKYSFFRETLEAVIANRVFAESEVAWARLRVRCEEHAETIKALRFIAGATNVSQNKMSLSIFCLCAGRRKNNSKGIQDMVWLVLLMRVSDTILMFQKQRRPIN